MTKTRDLSDFLIEGGADLPLGKPHIVPDVLHPSYVALGSTSNKLLDGTTDHSGAFGTVQSDGRKYYYTNIKGSKPIKDPRIGTHFGSQRHKFKSLQLLEQETATHGSNVYSIDGREWARAVDVTSGAVATSNDSIGEKVVVHTDKEGWIEVVGYFNAVNLIMRVQTNKKSLTPYINGTAGSTQTPQEASVNTPLSSRYVNDGSVVSLTLPTTSLGINTLLIKDNIESSHSTNYHFGIELIAQDTTSTANRSKIQIPSQNVVSHGKKFNVSGTPHYDPFTTMSYGGSGTTLSALQSLIDTDTSLGMDAWKAGTSNYHRPWNGGRVIKWVDSSGTIKTSVNMMPPNAQNISTTASNAVSDAHVIAGTNDDTINFNTSAIDHSQAEVAKTFHFREFGNGSANGTITGNYPDASMLDTGTNRDIAYVMDDGLTSLSAHDVRTDSTRGTIRTDGINDTYYITFIGTGFTFTNQSGGTTFGSGDDFDFIVDGVVVKSWQSGSTINEKTTVVQNLPYGTHVFQMLNTAAPASEHMHAKEFTFHQPKKPPIPEDACVLADYMLMADYVKQSATGSNITGQISKGVRISSASKDHFYNSSSNFVAANSGTPVPNVSYGLRVRSENNDTSAKLPFFGTNAEFHIEDQTKPYTAKIGGSSTNITKLDNTGSSYMDRLLLDSSVDLGMTSAELLTIQSGYNLFFTHVATPIHTSSHYQPFESPFLHELVGGDRNMEQTNLVVSPDGKTWDQITRDTSYIGSMSLCQIRTGSAVTTHNNDVVFDECRGKGTHSSGTGYGLNLFNKDFAIAYDRFTCLRDGEYEISTYSNNAGVSAGGNMGIQVSTSTASNALSYANPGDTTNTNMSLHNFSSITLNRGDYIRIQGRIGSLVGSWIQIKRLS